VVNIATEHYAAEIERAARPLAANESEFDMAGLIPTPSLLVGPPRIQQAAIAFECRTLQVVPVGRSSLVIGEVVYLHFADGLVDERYRIDFAQLRAIGRMAGSRYTRTTDTFVLDDENFFRGNR
jgi:flavin reductase (DIM6/NTAB) family NADH-FMN oxidoreductase RutF